MSWYAWLTFVSVYFVAVATPGPGVAAVIAQALSRGAVGAPAFIAGFVMGDLIWFTAASLGLSALAQTAHTAFLLVRYVGAAYLLWMAYKLWTKAPRVPADAGPDFANQRPHKLFVTSLTLTLGNPKPMLFFVALLPTVVPLETLRLPGYLAIGAAIAVVMPSIMGFYVLAASRARVFFQSPRALKALNRGSGTMMAAAALAVAAR